MEQVPMQPCPPQVGQMVHAAAGFFPSPLEHAYMQTLFATASAGQGAVVSGRQAVAFMKTSRVPRDKLREIWTIADSRNAGHLTFVEFAIAYRLIGIEQTGRRASRAQLASHKDMTLPPSLFEGIRAPPVAAVAELQRNQYYSLLFASVDVQQTGKVQGREAVAFFRKSNLDKATLRTIWELADSAKRFYLTFKEFFVALQLIAAVQAHRPLSLASMHDSPSTLPLPRFSGITAPATIPEYVEEYRDLAEDCGALPPPPPTPAPTPVSPAPSPRAAPAASDSQWAPAEQPAWGSGPAAPGPASSGPIPTVSAPASGGQSMPPPQPAVHPPPATDAAPPVAAPAASAASTNAVVAGLASFMAEEFGEIGVALTTASAPAPAPVPVPAPEPAPAPAEAEAEPGASDDRVAMAEPSAPFAADAPAPEPQPSPAELAMGQGQTEGGVPPAQAAPGQATQALPQGPVPWAALDEYAHWLFPQVPGVVEGKMQGRDAVMFFLRSGLSKGVLRDVWSMADQRGQHYLGPHEFATALRLIAAVQQGRPLAYSEVADHAPPLTAGPMFEGVPPLIPPAAVAAEAPPGDATASQAGPGPDDGGMYSRPVVLSGDQHSGGGPAAVAQPAPCDGVTGGEEAAAMSAAQASTAPVDAAADYADQYPPQLEVGGAEGQAALTQPAYAPAAAADDPFADLVGSEGGGEASSALQGAPGMAPGVSGPMDAAGEHSHAPRERRASSDDWNAFEEPVAAPAGAAEQGDEDWAAFKEPAGPASAGDGGGGGEEEGFGSFEEPAAAPAGAAEQDHEDWDAFKEPGGPETTQQAGQGGGEEEGFGSFEEPAAAPAGAAEQGHEDWDAFKEPAGPATGQEAGQGGGEEEGFGTFEEPAAAPASASGQDTEDWDAFNEPGGSETTQQAGQGEQQEGFGSFEEPAAAPAGAAEEDHEDWDAFEDAEGSAPGEGGGQEDRGFPAEAAAAQAAPEPAVPDDPFAALQWGVESGSVEVGTLGGGFDSPTPAPAHGALSAEAASGGGGLGRVGEAPTEPDGQVEGPWPEVLQHLMQQERFFEALACAEHAEAAQQIEVVSERKRVAMAEDRFEDAIVARDQVSSLQERLASDAVQGQWRSQRPPAWHQTTAQLREAAFAAVGRTGPAAEAAAAALDADIDLSGLAQADLRSAALMHTRMWWTATLAEAAHSGERRAAVHDCWRKVLRATRNTLEVGAATLEQVARADPPLAARAMTSDRVTTFLRGAAAMMGVCARVEAARTLACAADEEGSGLVAAVHDAWASMQAAAHRAAETAGEGSKGPGPDVDSLLADDSAAAADAVVDAVVEDSLSRAARAAGGGFGTLGRMVRCAICSLPLLPSDTKASHAGAAFHLRCGNHWINAVDEPLQV